MKLTSFTIRLITGESQFLRRLSTVTSPVPSQKPPETRRCKERQYLYKQIWGTVTTKENVSDVLHRIKRNGGVFTRSDLIFCLKDLRKFGRYQQCLEVNKTPIDGNRFLLAEMKLITTNSRLIYGSSHLLCRLFATSEINPREKPAEYRQEFNNPSLYKRLSLTWSTGEKVGDILDQISRKKGKKLKQNDLVRCIKRLRKLGRYQLCLEILEWMEKSHLGNFALHLTMIYKVKGIFEAEKYFYSLPPDEQNRFTYGALLYCYCSEYMTDKALAFFIKMDRMNYASNELAFSNLMCLYMKVDQPEKVPPLIEEMKRRRIPLGSGCYQPWIQSYASLKDCEGIERVMDEFQKQIFAKDEWAIYNSFASAYVKVGLYQKADQCLKNIETILDSSISPDYVGYEFLISFYASLDDLASVDRVWGKFKSKFYYRHNVSYLTMLQALSKLGSIEHLKKCFEEWNTSKYLDYDVRLPTVVIGAYLRHGMFDEAELMLKDAADRAGQKIWAAHVAFVDYYLEKHQFDSALKHLEVALANQWPWQRLAGKLDKFFEYFIEEKDVDGAEHVCQMLEKVQPLLPTTYMGLLQTYAAAGKTATEMRQRMAQSGINVGTELEELLVKVNGN